MNPSRGIYKAHKILEGEGCLLGDAMSGRTSAEGGPEMGDQEPTNWKHSAGQ